VGKAGKEEMRMGMVGRVVEEEEEEREERGGVEQKRRRCSLGIFCVRSRCSDWSVLLFVRLSIPSLSSRGLLGSLLLRLKPSGSLRRW